MDKTVSIFITMILVAGLGLVFFGGSDSNDIARTATNQTMENIEIIDGVQYITINAKSGYSPKLSTAQAGIPSKLIVKTNGTLDCSASLAIHSIDYQEILSPTADTVIDIGIKKAGETLEGICGMGMYTFEIIFG